MTSPAPERSLWECDDAEQWASALKRYHAVIAAQGVGRLAEHQAWYDAELPAAIADRLPPYVLHAELVRVTEWKMARGVWRARNLVLVRGNAPDAVQEASAAAFALVPHPTKAIGRLSTLTGVGPATASAVLAAAAPAHYPFFDELVAHQVPGLGAVKFTLGYYARYAEALRLRAEALGTSWLPATVERALWAHAGGKAGVPGHDATVVLTHGRADTMVDITIEDDTLTVEVQGMHKLWALKSTLQVPLGDVLSVKHDPERATRAFPGLKVPGTHIPMVYTAGTYYQSDFRPDFWSVRRPEHAIVIQCRSEAAYDEIIVEVEDPAGTVARIRDALAARASR